jgi:predicted acylesterase/phospholipase RssA
MVAKKAVILSSGGHNGIFIVQELKKHAAELSQVRTYIGTSVGSLICLLLILTRNNVEWTADLFCRFAQVASSSEQLDPRDSIFGKPDIINVEKTFAIFPSHNLISIIQVILSKFGLSWDITLSMFSQYTQSDVYFTATCVETGEAVYFNNKVFPKMKLVDAIYASCAIPFIFQPMLFRDQMYVDGALVDPYPVKFATDTLKIPADEVLGFYLHHLEPVETPTNFVDYGRQILSIILDRGSDKLGGIKVKAAWALDAPAPAVGIGHAHTPAPETSQPK